MTDEKIQFDESQQAAIEKACASKFALITGGAGYGKTTLIGEICRRLGSVDLMAPTGKAACRLSEGTGYQAATIHRHLLYDGTTFNRNNPFSAPVIVDEASMVDSHLLASLLSYKPRQLILVGDAAQLPPVGRGQPFHDLLAIVPDLSIELTTCYRATGAVHVAAQAIRRGESPDPDMSSGGERWLMTQTGKPEYTVRRIAEWVQAGGQYNPATDIFLAPQYGSAEQDSTDGGIRHINRTIKSIVNPSTDPIAPGDRVIVNKNFGTDDLWNGDLGTVVGMDTKGRPVLKLDRDPMEHRQLSTEQSREIDLAYCLSVHKSQGSQFRRVFFVCFRRHCMMLSRSLIYTGITRAQQGCVVMGELQAFYAGIGRQPAKRTVLQYLANGEVFEVGEGRTMAGVA